jgi:hypothetical protein
MFGSSLRGLALGLALWLLAGSTAHAKKSTLTVNFDARSMASTLWIPDKLPVIRGVLVFTGGQGANDQSGDTRPYADSRFYQRFAESIGFAILGSQFTGAYTEAGGGPGQALIDTLEQFATKLNRSELAHAPLLLEGFSNGGYFSLTFAKFKPERVIAFSLNKSGFAKVQMDPALAAVPGVLFWGEEELTKGLPTVIHSIVVQGRREHALWAELKEWGRGHEEGTVERMVVPFFAEMVALRYPAGKTPLRGEVPLVALDETSGWLADHSEASIQTALPVIAPFASYTGDKAAASWLPNENLATLWRGFVTKSPIQLDLPVSEAQLSATQVLQLCASGLADGETVTFYDGAIAVAKDLPVNANGEARGQWRPMWGGGRGFLAIAKTDGVATRTSRPAVVALYGKPPPRVPVPRVKRRP